MEIAWISRDIAWRSHVVGTQRCGNPQATFKQGGAVTLPLPGCYMAATELPSSRAVSWPKTEQQHETTAALRRNKAPQDGGKRASTPAFLWC